jgi:hypothetical protein
MLNALRVQGFGAIWLSSGRLDDPMVKRSLGFAEAQLLPAWIYAGTPTELGAPVEPADASGFWSAWT